jgi:FdrA protein
MITAVRRYAERYVDSVLLLAATRAMREAPGITWATAVMATPANLEALGTEGFVDQELDDSTAADLVLAIRGGSGDEAETALKLGDDALFGARVTSTAEAAVSFRTIGAAAAGLASADVAIISVPGPFAALEAHKAISAGLHVLLFSDNVSVEEEIALKDHGRATGKLMMGPGAGTAMLGQCGLGFANVVRPGRVGIVSAAGTGAQEVMSLLDQWGEGVTQVIGVGGRDLSEAVGGRMARLAVQALEADPDTELIVLVSKPPSIEVARTVVAEARRTPLVAALVGWPSDAELAGPAAVASTLEGGAARAIEFLGGTPPTKWLHLQQDVEQALRKLAPRRTLIRGLYSGGTLCYEALTVLQPLVGGVWSNTPLDKALRVPAPSGSHTALDLGEEEYTQGRPHPMIDPAARLEHLAGVAEESDVAVILMDVVLGHGSHADPASELVPPLAAIASRENAPVIVVYVCGTQGDPQGFDRQGQAFRDAGCIVAPTGARAALAAAAISRRDPSLVLTAL